VHEHRLPTVWITSYYITFSPSPKRSPDGYKHQPYRATDHTLQLRAQHHNTASQHPTYLATIMADVEMTDAGAAPKMKNTKAGASGDVAEGKKKFEVKKV